MCDWLSSGDWSDVQIVCGGRSFGAHKAVLASVSAFLRSTFLSSTVDEVPTFVILPDFDMDAMSSVLYYVYKGEVKIERHKLQLFLDIIRAMQIYIDYQYLADVSNEEIEAKHNTLTKPDAFAKNIYTLTLRNEQCQNIFNIKKITERQSVILQYEQTDLDFHDYNVRSQNESELSKARLGNLKSPYADRQRNSFLRDLFIETYPRNGNVNGRTEGVLAISNECYHSPTSVLSANANGKHLDVNDALPTMCNNSTNILPFPNVHLNRNQHSDVANHVDTKFPAHLADTLLYCCRQTTVNVQNDYCTRHLHALPEVLPSLCSVSSLKSTSNIDNRESLRAFPNDTYKISKCHNICSGGSAKTIKRVSSKVIFNQVLQSPWSSRKPNNYRPFRRKLNQDHPQDTKIDKAELFNDGNNNIQTTTDNAENGSDVFEEKVPIELALTSSQSADGFKCSFCNQVFTSGEALEGHLRRHSTNARYTCGECGKTFSQLRNFKYHMSIHRGTREFAATCTVCGKYFNDRGYLSSHMKIHRNRKEYKCTQCPKSFNQRVAYNMHVRIHTGIKPHVCEECGKAFSRKMLLKQHQRTHSGERPYACTHCDKRFADRSNMTLHLRLHTGVKPFSCSMCPKSFTKKHHLKSHLNFHTGSKPYSCPRCGLSFTQSSNMRTHMKKCSAPEKAEDTQSTSTS